VGNSELVLTKCLEEIRSGKATLEECLEQYPHLREELEPLLQVALHIRQPAEIEPDPEFKARARARLMNRIVASSAPKSGIRVPGFHFAGLLRPVTAVVSIVLILLIAFTGTAFASQESLPGDLLYSVKTAGEEIRRTFAFNDTTRAGLEMDLAATRLQEMSKLTGQGRSGIETALKGYENNLHRALEAAARVKIAQDVVLERMSGASSEQAAFCDAALDRNPEDRSLSAACSGIIDHQVKTLHLLAALDSERAQQINIKAMEIRLERATAKAERNEYSQMNQALEQYLALCRSGEEIAQSSAASGKNESANGIYLQALTQDFLALQALVEEVPEDFRGNLEKVRHESEGFQHRAEMRNRAGDNPGEQPGPDNGIQQGKDNGGPQDSPGKHNGPPETLQPAADQEDSKGNKEETAGNNGQGKGKAAEATPETGKEGSGSNKTNSGNNGAADETNGNGTSGNQNEGNSSGGGSSGGSSSGGGSSGGRSSGGSSSGGSSSGGSSSGGSSSGGSSSGGGSSGGSSSGGGSSGSGSSGGAAKK